MLTFSMLRCLDIFDASASPFRSPFKICTNISRKLFQRKFKNLRCLGCFAVIGAINVEREVVEKLSRLFRLPCGHGSGASAMSISWSLWLIKTSSSLQLLGWECLIKPFILLSNKSHVEYLKYLFWFLFKWRQQEREKNTDCQMLQIIFPKLWLN